MGRALKRAQEHLALALAGFVICATALLPLIAVIAGAPLSSLAPLASATPWLLLLRSCALAVQAIDPSLEEAGRLSAPPWRVAVRIVLPVAWPAAALGALLVFALSLSELGIPMFLRIRAYPAAVFSRLGAIDYSPGEAAVLAMPLVAVALALLAVERRIGARRSFAVLGMRSEERPALRPGRFRWAATVACWSAAAASVLPIAGLAWSALRGNGFAQVGGDWIGAGIENSVVPAALAATLLTAVGLVLGRSVARDRPGGAWLDALAVFAFVTPAAVLGVGIIDVWNRPSTHALYRTAAILVIGFAARYAIIPARAIAVAIAQGSPHLEEAASVQGAGFLLRLRRIVVPLHRRALLGA